MDIAIVYFLLMFASLVGIMFFYIEQIKDCGDRSISVVLKSIGFVISFLIFAFCLFAFAYNVGLDDAGYHNGNVITNYIKEKHRF